MVRRCHSNRWTQISSMVSWTISSKPGMCSAKQRSPSSLRTAQNCEGSVFNLKVSRSWCPGKADQELWRDRGVEAAAPMCNQSSEFPEDPILIGWNAAKRNWTNLLWELGRSTPGHQGLVGICPGPITFERQAGSDRSSGPGRFLYYRLVGLLVTQILQDLVIHYNT